MTAPYFISALRNEEDGQGFYRYFANAKDGQAVTLTYSFLTSVPDGTPVWDNFGDPKTSFATLTVDQQALIRQAMDRYEEVVNVKFELTAGTADIRFGTFSMKNNVTGYADYPQYVIGEGQLSHGANHGEVWYDKTSLDSNAIYLAMHEIGHSLGLKHPVDGTNKLSPAEDNSDNTIMSYTHGPSNQQPLAPQLFDVIALQSIYGPAQQRMGDDTYVFGKDKLIWDGGGTDTITAAKASSDVTINLNDGSWNYIGSKAALFTDDSGGTQVYLGNFTMIENLVGSGFNDHLTGNELANMITAGKGNDDVAGGNGKDHIAGGNGADTLSGGKGADTFLFLSRTDSTVTAAGRDTLGDFSHQQRDKIDLAALDANSHTKADDGFSFISDHGFSKHAGELRFAASGGDTLVSADMTGDGRADFAFLIHGNVDLVKGDFLL